MVHDDGADLDQLLARRGQRPRLHFLRQHRGPQQVAEIRGQGMQLEANRVRLEAVVGEVRLADRLPALLDILLGCSSSIVELV